MGHSRPSEGGPTDEGHARWRSGQFRVLDDSVANLLLQMVLAIGGMSLAYLASEWLNDRWFGSRDDTIAFLARGAVFCLLGSASIYVTSARPIRRALLAQRAAIAAHESALEDQAARHLLVSRLQSAFDMAESDHDAFGVVSTALGTVSDQPAELLLADSSRAHLRPVAVAAVHGGTGMRRGDPVGLPGGAPQPDAQLRRLGGDRRLSPPQGPGGRAVLRPLRARDGAGDPDGSAARHRGERPGPPGPRP